MRRSEHMVTPVLFITYYWPPSGGAGVQRGLKFVKYLPLHGVRPIVLTVDPAQASYPALDPSLEAEVPADVRVVRTPSFEPLRLLAALGGRGAVPGSSVQSHSLAFTSISRTSTPCSFASATSCAGA